MAKKKLSLTEQVISDILGGRDLYVEADEFTGCCGMSELYSLNEFDGLDVQVALLKNEMKKGRVGQVVITDVVKNEKKIWAETKAAAFKGPITRNPKSNNLIRLYVITPEVIEELEALYFEKKAHEKKFKGTPAKPKALKKT